MTQARLKELFDAHYSGLHSFCVRMVRDEAVADDLVQGVFVRVWMRRDDLEGESVGRAYLYRSVRNAAVSWLRKRAPIALEGNDDLPEPLIDRSDPSVNLEEQRLRSVVTRAIDRLPIRCREVFVLVREQGMSYREAAEALGVSPKTVDAHMVRAMRSLRDAVGGFVSTSETHPPGLKQSVGRD